MKKHIIAMAFLSSVVAHADFLPPNHLDEQDNLAFYANITEGEFRNIVFEVANTYKPVFEFMGVKLTPQLKWSDPTVNASAQQFSPTDWRINMYGGLARRPEVTQDGFALVVCHELGHHLGGFPFYGEAQWAAAEGQADYFATQSCAKWIWSHDTEKNQQARLSASLKTLQYCDSQWELDAEKNLCVRSVNAAESLSALLAAVGNQALPQVDINDETVVRQTQVAHPFAQCRLNTYVQGALCKIQFNKFLVPGKSSDSRVSLESEKEALDYSCGRAAGDIIGNRPLCWFAPRVQSLGLRAIAITPSVVNSPQDLSHVNIQFKNRSTQSLASAQVKLSSRSGVVMQPSTLDFSQIGAGTQQVRVVNLSNANNILCGENLNLTTQAVGALPQEFSILIGTQAQSSVGYASSRQSIPDNNLDGVTSQIRSSIRLPVVKAKLTIEVSHEIPSDLKFALVSPGGNAYQGYFPSAPSSKNSFEFVVETKEKSGAGNWILKVWDSRPADIGKLLGWKLDLVNGICH